MGILSKIREAATILLVRPSEARNALEVFMVKRPGRGDFPDLHVYPGGKVDHSDSEIFDCCVGFDDVVASERLHVQSKGLRFWVTVIRECFEEAGVLLALRNGQPFTYQSQKEKDRYSEIQGQLMAGEMDFSEFVRSEKLQLAVSDVYYLSHWITPSSAPARFDTRFFLAAMPDDQVADRHERELVSGQWVTATDALEHHENKRWQMIYPTITNLKSIASYSTVAEVVTAVEKRQHLPSINTELHQQGMQYDSV